MIGSKLVKWLLTLIGDRPQKPWSVLQQPLEIVGYSKTKDNNKIEYEILNIGKDVWGQRGRKCIYLVPDDSGKMFWKPSQIHNGGTA